MSESVNKLKVRVAELLQQNSDIVKVLERQHEINYKIAEELKGIKETIGMVPRPTNLL